MFYVYILQSEKNGRYYTGSTNHLPDRLARHNAGQVFSTKPYIPWKLIYQEEFSSLPVAHRREYQIKAWKSRNAIEKLIHLKFSPDGGPIV